MSDVVVSVAIIVTMAMLLVLVQGHFASWERPWLWGSLFAHVLAGVAQVVIVSRVYGGGDMFSYRRTGMLLAQFLREYPVEGALGLFQVFLHQREVIVPVPLMMGATGAMQVVSGFVMLMVNDSIYGACILFGGLTFFSHLAMYRVFRFELDTRFHRAALVGCLWVPSVVFWSSALLKEPVAVVGLGLLIYGGHALATRRRPVVGLVLFALGGLLAGPVKPYLLGPFGLAVGVWFYLDGPRPALLRRIRQLRPGAFIVGAGFATIFIVFLVRLFPELNPSDLAEQTANMQAGVEKTHGGSDYSIGDPEARSFSGQLRFLPVSLLTALFRPTVLDVHNAQSAVNALETTTITILLVVALVRSGPVGAVRVVFRSPVLGFCAIYVLGLAIGVGLGTTNLGTLSRYRMPLMPFFVTLAAVLASRESRALLFLPNGSQTTGAPGMSLQQAVAAPTPTSSLR